MHTTTALLGVVLECSDRCLWACEMRVQETLGISYAIYIIYVTLCSSVVNLKCSRLQRMGSTLQMSRQESAAVCDGAGEIVACFGGLQ